MGLKFWKLKNEYIGACMSGVKNSIPKIENFFKIETKKHKN